MRRKLVSPGYRDDFDLVLRDQTEVLRHKAVAATRARTTRKAPSAKTALDFNDCQEGVVARPTAIRRMPGIDVIPGVLKVTAEEVALANWFEKFILLYRDQNPTVAT
ncbi:hypothetical protein MMC13_003565 [Lambiella insularis]|nr:hypothetical protein [Lambiella insularis]